LFESAVVNASPLIYLGRTGNLHLIEGCARNVWVPDVVLDEIRAGQNEPAAPVVDAAAWLKAVSVGNVPPHVAAWNLGAGESAVLAWALAHAGTRAVIDDREGRRCAAQLGVKVVGTVGLVLAAKRRGLVPAARPLIDELIASGLYLSEEIADRALALVGE
jgi:predicted nucleic acid-binding protein